MNKKFSRWLRLLIVPVVLATLLVVPLGQVAAATWAETKVTAIDGKGGSQFGNSVAISGDNAVIGAPGYSTGSAYIFHNNGSIWLELDKLSASDKVSGDQFGAAVDISGDLVIVGAPYHDDSGSNSGSAYIFRYSGGTWLQEAELLASDGVLNDNFGNAVSIDGDTAMVGAYLDDDGATNSGSVYVFQ
jgi:hypothetical protein